MADPRKKRPFNLLYRSDLQKEQIDKMYEFVVGPGRIIVVLVMFSIVIAFIFRFPLDKQLNDVIDESQRYVDNLELIGDEKEDQFRVVEEKTEDTKKFVNIYKDQGITEFGEDAGPDMPAQYKVYDIYNEVDGVLESFYDDIVVAQVEIYLDPISGGRIEFSGYTEKFELTDELKDQLLALDTYIDDVLSKSIAATQETQPQFSLEIRLKPAGSEAVDEAPLDEETVE